MSHVDFYKLLLSVAFWFWKKLVEVAVTWQQNIIFRLNILISFYNDNF